jgi:hypothetical protein
MPGINKCMTTVSILLESSLALQIPVSACSALIGLDVAFGWEGVNTAVTGTNKVQSPEGRSTGEVHDLCAVQNPEWIV